MTKHDKINQPEGTLMFVPLNQLYLHEMNPRQQAPADDPEAMAISISINGLMQNLVGYADPEGQGVGIVAGGRRLRGLQLLAEKSFGILDSKAPDLQKIPVKVTTDPFQARSWAGTESESQMPLHPAEEIRAYAQMAEQGNSADIIARAFTKTVRHVKGRLALSHLQPETIDALRAGKISLDGAKALTLARSTEQELEVLEAAIQERQPTWWIKGKLTGETIKGSDHRVRFIGLDAYASAGGLMTEDLFEEQTYLSDGTMVDTLFKAKLAETAEAMRIDGGWQWVETCETSTVYYSDTSSFIRVPPNLPGSCTEEELAEYEALCDEGISVEELDRLNELERKKEGDWDEELRAASGIFVFIDSDGKPRIEGVYQIPARKSSQDGETGTAEAPPEDRPKLTQAGVEDLRRIELLALQTAAVGKTELILDLFAWQLDRRQHSFSNPFGVSLTSPQIKPEAEGAWTVDERLEEGCNDYKSPGAHEDPAKSFEAFQALGKKHRNAVLTRHLVRTLQGGTVNSLAKQLLADRVPIDIRSVWTPDAPTYFSRIGSKDLESIWAQLVEAGEDGGAPAWFVKLKKGEKVHGLHKLFTDPDYRTALQLTDAQISAIAAWLPPELEEAG